jgi:hypothetical protein
VSQKQGAGGRKQEEEARQTLVTQAVTGDMSQSMNELVDSTYGSETEVAV